MPDPVSDPVTRLNAALEGRYTIERELGEGGMATVYLADDIKHNRKVGGFVAAEVEADSVFRVLRSETLFDTSGYFLVEGSDSHDIGPDDERFLMIRIAVNSGDSGVESRFILVQNWFEELRERMGN